MAGDKKQKKSKGDAPVFQRNTFEPVIQVSPLFVKDAPLPVHLDDSSSGIRSVVVETIEQAVEAVLGRGGEPNLDVGAIPDIASLITSVLIARNCCEQLRAQGRQVRYATLLCQELRMFEPIIKVYNNLGAFKLDEKEYGLHDLDWYLSWHVVNICRLIGTTQFGADRLTPIANSDLTQRILRLGATGEIQVDNTGGLFDRQKLLIERVLASNIWWKKRLVLVQEILDCSSYEALESVKALVQLEGVNNIGNWNAWSVQQVGTARTSLARIFPGLPDPLVNGTRLPIDDIRTYTDRALRFIAGLTIRLAASMPVQSLPRYEGGSAAQLVTVRGNVLHAHSRVDLISSTVGYAGRIALAAGRLKVAIQSTPEGMLRRLVQRSTARAAG